MTARLDHLIVHATDHRASARLLGALLGLEPASDDGPFVLLQVDDVTLDFMTTATVLPQHYAFTVDDDRFDLCVAQLQAGGHPTFADPMHRAVGIGYLRDGRRTCYFSDPDQHNIEIIPTSR